MSMIREQPNVEREKQKLREEYDRGLENLEKEFREKK